MPIPLLPSLKESNKIAKTKRGEWMSDAQTNLGNLADDLKVTAGVKSDISSIPDLWARPSMYELVLYDENHHLHKRFLDEWRGVLAILALREMRTLGGVAVNTVEIPPETQLQENAPMFLKVITKNLPEEYKRFPDKTIEHGYKFHVISYVILMVLPERGCEEYHHCEDLKTTHEHQQGKQPLHKVRSNIP